MSKLNVLARTLMVCLPAFVGACGSDAGGDGPDPLLGTWTYSGSVPSRVDVTLTFESDGSFTGAEDVTPAGIESEPCVTTELYEGTYVENASSGANTLTFGFARGTRNQVSGCSDPSDDSPGTPMTPEDIVSYRDQGLIPPETVTYAVTSTTLLLSSPEDGMAGIGRGSGSSFTRSE